MAADVFVQQTVSKEFLESFLVVLVSFGAWFIREMEQEMNETSIKYWEYTVEIEKVCYIRYEESWKKPINFKILLGKPKNSNF